eukprot:1160094-Pelagomonas_calceolata.AAC.8
MKQKGVNACRAAALWQAQDSTIRNQHFFAVHRSHQSCLRHAPFSQVYTCLSTGAWQREGHETGTGLPWRCLEQPCLLSPMP